MKIRILVFILLCLCTALSLSIISIFSPTGLAQKRIYTSTRSARLDERIRRVENGLLLPFIVKGEPNMTMKLVNRMRFYKIPGVSIGVINNGKIEWARGYGVQETGGNRYITPETLFQAASISKPIVAMAMLRLVQENKLNLDEDVNEKLVSWKVPENNFKEKVIVSVEPKIYDIYAGQYQIAPNFILTITNENGKLMSQATRQPTFELFAESETEFFLKESETEIKFVKNTQGKVTGLVSRERDKRSLTPRAYRNIFVQKIK